MHQSRSFVASCPSRAVSFAAATSLERLESRVLLAVHPFDIGEFRGRPGQWADLHGTNLFTTTDLPAGQLLWASDGTRQGTRLVKDLETEASPPSMWALFGRDDALVVGDTYFFTGVDNAHGRELWASDGTPNGTRLVADLVPGVGDSEPEGFVELNGQLLFTADKKLWRSDGTTEGTVMIADVDPLGSFQPERMAVLDGHAYFTVYPDRDPYNGDFNTGELYRTDGTEAGTVLVRDITPNGDVLNVTPSRSGLINVGGTLYFSANDGDHGWELWRSNGTKSSTLMVRDLAPRGDNPNLDGSYPDNLTDVNGTLFFSAAGFLWKTDGTSSGTEKLKTVTQARGFVNVNGLLFFVSDQNIWVSDGTKEGTRKVADGQIAERFGPDGVGFLNGRLYFGADGGSGFELYETDGTLPRTALVYEAQEGNASSHAQVLGRAGAKIVFTARNDETAKWQVYSLDIPAPHRPTELQLVQASDSGIVRSDRVTNISRPTFSGSAPADSLVRLYDSGVEIGNGVARLGKFTITANKRLSDGTHTLYVSATDDLGRTSVGSSRLNVKIDTAPPRVKFKAISPAQLELKFSENVGATLRANDLSLRNLETGQQIPAADMQVAYNDHKNTAILTFPTRPGGLAIELHELVISTSGVTDIAGNSLAAPNSFRFTPPAPAVGVSRNALRINGTTAADEIVVRLKAGNASRIEVLLNGSTTEHLTSSVSNIIINAFAGDDLIRIDHSNGAVKIGANINAGDGNDTVFGSATRDRISGGKGDDHLHGGGGHDIIYGEAGNDFIQGERGNDYLVGGAGIDTIQGNAGADRLYIDSLDDVLSEKRDSVYNEVA